MRPITQMRPITSRIGAMLRLNPPDDPGDEEAMRRSVAEALAEQREEPAAVPPLRPRIQIPTCAPCPEDTQRTELRDRGRALAREDNWDMLAQEIERADRARDRTPDMYPVAGLLAEGARADVVQAAHGAIMSAEPRQALAAIAALDAIRRRQPQNGALAYVVAATHVDAANAWRGASTKKMLSPQRREGFIRHMNAAARLADRFDALEQDSALWAQLRCRVLDIDAAPHRRVCDDYEDLIDLDPGCPDHLRAFGRDLLPSRYGTFEALDAQARRTAMLTRDVWGIGGYTWIWIGAIEADPGAPRRLDVGLFREGLRDILDRFPDQRMVNRMAAFTGVTFPSSHQGTEAAHALAQDFYWIAGERLTELHPMVWAWAPVPSRTEAANDDGRDTFARGKARALSTLAERFGPEIARFGHITFDEHGLQRP